MLREKMYMLRRAVGDFLVDGVGLGCLRERAPVCTCRCYRLFLLAAGSRSVSPSSRLSYITHTQPDITPSSTPGKASRVLARSQGSSRDASPSRAIYGQWSFIQSALFSLYLYS